ncbi:MAG: endonuclease III [Chlamydiae bacterium]|nr:endonuclease III [Chlamydiota bacterium]
MNKKDKAIFILNTLEKLFPSPSIPLSHVDSYTLLIAVLLSAQSTDARVNLITPILFAKAKTPEEMIKLSPEEIGNIIRPCGLGPTKARAIWHLSKMLIDIYEGKVPGSLEDLEKLPGVGHKTASVVLIQAFGIPAFPVDTHIHRCAKRWGLSKGTNVVQTENDLKKLFPKDTWIKLHLQIIYFARTYCPARGHVIEKCPICRVIPQKVSAP